MNEGIMPQTPEVIVVSSASMADEFARRVGEVARSAVRERGHFSLALSGGSIAPALLPTFGAADLPWEAISFFWIDERAVSPDDPESNFGSALKLLAETPAGGAQVFPMETQEDLGFSARAYEATLASELGTPPVLDVAMLGVGPDGHVASLFPGHVQPAGAWVAAELHSPKPPRERLTLTFETLAAARLLCVVVLGAAKASLVRDFVERHRPDLPISRALASAREAWVFLDEEAASMLDASTR